MGVGKGKRQHKAEMLLYAVSFSILPQNRTRKSSDSKQYFINFITLFSMLFLLRVIIIMKRCSVYKKAVCVTRTACQLNIFRPKINRNRFRSTI